VDVEEVKAAVQGAISRGLMEFLTYFTLSASLHLSQIH
jgi:hypothetical protein